MKCMTSCLIIFPLTLFFQTTLLAETATHTHNGRTHNHPLPSAGLNHSHTPAARIAGQRKIVGVKKSPKAVRTRKAVNLSGNKKIKNNKPKIKKYKPPTKPKIRKSTATAKPFIGGSHTDCSVRVTISSGSKFTSMTSDRGNGSDIESYPVRIKNMYVLSAKTKKPYATVGFNLSPRSVKNVRDHRTGERYQTFSHNFTNILEGHTYIATLGGMWITEPRSIRFRCPNSKGERAFGLPRIKHIGIMGDG